MQNDNAAPAQPIPPLKQGLNITVHSSGDNAWYCLYDPWTQRYSRLGMREYVIASQLDGIQTPAGLVAQISGSNDTKTLIGDSAVTEDEVSRLCQWLAKSSLLEETASGPKAASPAAAPLNPLYIKLTLIPGHQLERCVRFLKPLINPFACLFIFALGLLAIAIAISRWSILSSTLNGLFVYESHWWWLVAWLLLKSVHEIGHALVAVRVGAPIRSAGISLIYLAPIPFVDITDMWVVANRWQRIACSAAGMLAEFALASVAVIVAVMTEQESIRYLCCAVATLGTVSTLVFNANPLMRFDGYFIFTDLIQRPNLWMHAAQSAKNLFNGFKNLDFHRQPEPVSLPLAVYGIACWFYRMSILITVAATAVLVWNSLGIAIVLWGAYALFLVPWLKARQMSKMAVQPKATVSRQVWIWRASVTAALLAAPWIIPSPLQPLSPGIVQFRQPWTIHAEAEGLLSEVPVAAGQKVNAGDILARLENDQLQLSYKLKLLEAQASREKIQYKQSRGELAEAQAEQAKLYSLEEQVRQLGEKVSRLTIRAPHGGTLASLPVQREIGRQISQGELICVLADTEQLDVKISLAQRDLYKAQKIIGKPASGRLVTGVKLTGKMDSVDPKGSKYLMEPLLAACYAGPLCIVNSTPGTGKDNSFQLLQPRFDAKLELPATEGFAPGQMAWVRLSEQRQSIGSAALDWFAQRWQTLQFQIQMTSQN